MHAEGDSNRKGQMQLKTNRLNNKNDEEKLQETELEKVFPDLFREETKERMLSKQEEQKASTNSLLEVIFEEKQLSTSQMDSADLFDEEYVTVVKTIGEEVEDVDSSISATVFITAFSVLIVGIVGGSYLFIRNFLM